MMEPCRRFVASAALVILLLAAGGGTTFARAADGNGASDALRQRYDAASTAMARSDFGRPMLIESSDQDSRVRGEVLALIEHPLVAVQQALQDPRRWCEIMLLTPSISRCAAQTTGAAAQQLAVRLSRRFDQPPDQAAKARFDFHPQTAADARYTAVRLDADTGPLDTSDYRIEVEALALDDHRTIVRMAYSYRYGLKARLATQAYLATKAGGKVGFTRVEGPQGDARVGGMRGSVERNAMRYYLAIEANVAQAGEDPAPAERLKASLDRWLEAIARYPRQLAEPDPVAYRRVKRELFTQAVARGGAD